jgi:hypothetical protein
MYVLVAVDWFSNHILPFPLWKANASNVIRCIEDNVFLVFGIPQYIIADNGTQFADKDFRKFTEEYKVQDIWYNTKYHQQVNFTERTNLTLGTAIHSYVTKHKQWGKDIVKLQHALNTAKHELTGYTHSNVLKFWPSFTSLWKLLWKSQQPMTWKFYRMIAINMLINQGT